MSAVEFSPLLRFCDLCGEEIEEEPGVCFVCACGCSFAIRTVSVDEQLGLARYVPELPAVQ